MTLRNLEIQGHQLQIFKKLYNLIHKGLNWAVQIVCLLQEMIKIQEILLLLHLIRLLMEVNLEMNNSKIYIDEICIKIIN
jgi:hypothetical protein